MEGGVGMHVMGRSPTTCDTVVVIVFGSGCRGYFGQLVWRFLRPVAVEVAPASCGGGYLFGCGIISDGVVATVRDDGCGRPLIVKFKAAVLPCYPSAQVQSGGLGKVEIWRVNRGRNTIAAS